MRANGFSDADLQKGSQGMIFGLTFVFSLIMAGTLAGFLGEPKVAWAWGMAGGAAASLCVALGIAVIALFERRPWSYILVNGGYWVVSFLVMGGILGAWR